MKVVTSVNLTDKQPIQTGGFISLELTNILKAVCCINKVDIYDVKGRNRSLELAIARREFCYLSRELTSKSLKNIGKEISRHHATVLFHYKKTLTWLKIPGYHLSEKFELIEEKLKGS